MSQIRIATRQSALALWQANYVKTELERFHPKLEVSLVPMTSRGDQILDVSLAKVGGKGLFVKELEQAMLDDRADIAVHSMKDVPMMFPESLGLAVICEREDPRDAFVSNRYQDIDALPAGAVIGTSSLRRQSQLLAERPDIEVTFLRGNVNTRLNKLDAGEFDAIILASAGLKRLGFDQRIASYIAAEKILPAGGQGAVGIEYRSADTQIRHLLEPLHHRDTADCVIAERAMNRRLQGGCQVPIGAFAMLQDEDVLWLRGLVGEPNGEGIIFDEVRGDRADAERLGEQLADALLDAGAGDILARFCTDDHNHA